MGSSFQPDIAISESARLNSDQVNYLIWRKTGYGEAAVKLQRDWKLDPQSLPLAKHIKGGALVRLIKYGLRYYYTDQTWDRRAGKKISFQSSMLFFGPESARPSLQQDDDEPAAESETGTIQQALSPKSSSGTRKHARESGPNAAADQAAQHTPKRSRKSATTGHERNDEQRPQSQQNPESVMEDSVSMEVDHVGSHANSARSESESVPPVPEAKSPSPSELDQDTDMDMGVSNGVATQCFEASNGALGAGFGAFGPQPPDHQQRISHLPTLVPTLDCGHSVGVQFAPAKITDSGDSGHFILPESIILHVADEAHVTTASWRPFDSTVLAASGNDFSGVWKIPSYPSRPGAVLPPFQDVVDVRDDTMVSAMAWEPGGMMLAVAVFDNHTAGAIRIYDGQEAVLIESLPAADRLITTLRWQKAGSRLVGFASSPEESSLVLWDLSGTQPLAGAFSITVPEQVNDINWASHGNTSVICVAGDGVVYQCRAVPDLAVEHKWSSAPEDHTNWSLIRCSWWSDETAIIIAASANPPSLWIPDKNKYRRDIHNSLLTCLELRPAQPLYPDQDPHCDFATSSIDGTVKMWRYSDASASIDCLFKLTMAESSPVLGLAYTPDGNAIAAASYDKVTMWNAEKRAPALAKWVGDENAWGGAFLKRHRRRSQGETMSEDGGGRDDTEHSLSFDVESRKLAFALGNQVAVINFQQG